MRKHFKLTFVLLYLIIGSSLSQISTYKLGDCGGEIYTNTSGTIKYPLTGNYDNNVYCTWNIIMPKVYQMNIKSVGNIQLEPHDACSYDYIEIISKTNQHKYNSRTIYCKYTININASNRVQLNFRSDGTTQSTGFTLNYTVYQYPKKHNETCTATPDTCIGELVCQNSRCLCPANMTLFGNEICQFKQRGEFCKVDSSCDVKLGLSCQNNLCQCNSELAKNESLSKFENGAKNPCFPIFGKQCSPENKCHPDFECVDGVCECLDNLQIYDAKLKKCVSLIYGPCQNTEDCFKNSICKKSPYNKLRCECKSGYYSTIESPGKCMPGFKTPCYDPENRAYEKCYHKSLACINEICDCKSKNDLFDVKSLKCLGVLGSLCKSNEDCFKNLYCDFEEKNDKTGFKVCQFLDEGENQKRSQFLLSTMAKENEANSSFINSLKELLNN